VYVYQYISRQTGCSVFYFEFMRLPFASLVVKVSPCLENAVLRDTIKQSMLFN